LIGNKNLIGFELGSRVEGSSDLFEFDMWLLNQHVTCVDNIAYLKSFLFHIEDDASPNRDISKYSAYFEGGTAEDSHKFILSTRDVESANYDIENDEILPNQQVLNWGPNTDNISCFLIPKKDGVYLTLEFYVNGENTGNIRSEKIELARFNKILNEFVSYGANKI